MTKFTSKVPFASRMESPRFVVHFLLFCMLFPSTAPYIKEASNIFKLLYQTFREQYTPTKQIAVTEKAIKELAFDHYHEALVTETLQALDINQFDQVVDDIASELSIPPEKTRAILRGKHAKMGEKNFQEFVFKISDKGVFFYGRTITMKRDNGKEIDFAYAFYRVEFVLSKVKNEVVKLRNPIADFIFGVEKEIQYEDRSLTEENKESILGYFRKRCHEGFLREYPQIATDIKTKAISGKKEEL